MAWSDSLRALTEFDVNDLDFDNVGGWPTPIKIFAGLLVFVVIAVAGYYYHIDRLQERLSTVQNEEFTLRTEFEKKAFEAANLEVYKRQLIEMEESFGALVSQLPSDTEVPGLLEDITNKGELNGLTIEKIDLLDEVPQEFYVELPIQIQAVGSYHDLGAFVSGMAGLPRIVTLHDFDVSLAAGDSRKLKMEMQAKTYRYRDGEDE